MLTYLPSHHAAPSILGRLRGAGRSAVFVAVSAMTTAIPAPLKFQHLTFPQQLQLNFYHKFFHTEAGPRQVSQLPNGFYR